MAESNLGRIRYIEPTNFVNGLENTDANDSFISYPYEDYNMAVDLSICVTNRYSCGLGEESNETSTYEYSSKNGTISFLGGTKLGGESQEQGYLTTNYTDISMVNPGTNTQECLGIESINITYNSWMYPEVTIRFVDVRGATVMQPAEQGYYNENKNGTTSGIYRALFSFPYPIFTLKVKGYYGKGVTYKLAVQKISMEFDANTGNFIIIANFVGYMFGIYADIPMTYLAIAPYLPGGKEYWEENVSNGVFSFKDKAGGYQSGMITIPELRKRVAEAALSQDSVSAAADGEAVERNLTERTSNIDLLESSYPFGDWFEASGSSYIHKMYKGDVSSNKEEILSGISVFIENVKNYDDAHGTYYSDCFSSLYEEKKSGKIKSNLKNLIKFVKITTTENGRYNTNFRGGEEEKKEVLLVAKDYIVDFINQNSVISGTDFTLCALPKGTEEDFKEGFLKKLKEERDKIANEKTEEESYYREKSDAAIEAALGFKPSIQNIYNLAFAHMDTFMHCFYSMMKTIKGKLDGTDGNRELRSKSYFGITDNGKIVTDTERINGDANSRGNYLPPFTGFYEKKDDGGEKRNEMVWPVNSSIKNGSELDEVSFIENLLEAANTYNDEALYVEEYIKELYSGQTGDSKDTYNSSMQSVQEGGGANSPDIKMGIPLTIFDFVNKDRMKNPYAMLSSLVKGGDSNLESEVLGIFALRAYYYLCCEEGTTRDIEASSFGRLDAINFFKAVGDETSPAFLEFIQEYAMNQGNNAKINDFINIITSQTQREENGEWQFGTKTLFKQSGGKLIYSLYDGGDSGYNFLPLGIKNFNSIKDDYINDTETLLRNNDYISITNKENISGDTSSFCVGQPAIGGTFVLYENGSYLQAISDNIEAEIKSCDEKTESEDYGGRRKDEYDKLKKSNRTLKKLFDDYDAELDEKLQFDKGIIVDGEGKNVKKNDLKKAVKSGNFDELRGFYIKYPSIDGSKTKPIFISESYESSTDIIEKAFKFIRTIPNIKYGDVGNGVTMKCRLLNEGANYWLIDKNNINAGLRDGVTASRREYLKTYFIKWATDNSNNGFAGNEDALSNIEFYEENKKGVREYSNGLDIEFVKENPNSEAFKLQDFLRDLFFTRCTTFDYYDNTSDFKCSPDKLKEAFKGFMQELSQIYKPMAKDSEKKPNVFDQKITEAEKSNPFKNKDLKLSTYATLKALYDKWLCAPYNGYSETWSLNPSSTKSDFLNFIYSDSYYHKIGNNLNVNISKVSTWLSSCLPTENMESTESVMHYTGRTIYEFLSEIAQDCGGILMALPQKFGMYSADNIRDMFRSVSVNNNYDEDQSSFLFMYTYKLSEHLGNGEETSNLDMNGWSPEGDGFNLTDEEITGELFNDEGFTIPAFGVTFAKQNQSFFKNISLNTESQGITEAGIAATMNLASKGSEGPRESALYGQDLYRVYSNYAYGCSVEMLGNMQVMPLMYFQLNNIPMWKGAYMVQKVSHDITAGNIATKFEGVRLNKYAIPMAEDIINTNTVAGSGSNGSNGSGSNGGSGTISTDAGTNIVGDSSYETESLDFDANNVSETKPVICLIAGHGPKTQKAKEWKCMYNMITKKLAPRLRKLKYKDGTSYNVQVCNKNGRNTSAEGYSTREIDHMIKRFGSKCVISIACHWNGGAGARHETYVNKKSQTTREDSMALARCMLEAFNKVSEKGRAGEYSKMPEGMMSQKNSIMNLGENNSDGGPQKNCACVLTENYFGDYPSTERWNKGLLSGLGCEWLYDEDEIEGGMKIIAEGHVEGIKNYIESL